MHRMIIKTGVILLAVVAMICVWPLKLISREVENKSKAAVYYDSSPITDHNPYRQDFVPAQKYLESISVQLNRDTTMSLENEGVLTITLFNENNEVCASTSEPVKNITNKDYYAFELNTRVSRSETYYYTITVSECEGTGPTIRYGNTNEIGLNENTIISFDGTEYPQFSTVCIYHYKTDLTIWDILTYYSFVLLLALLLICEGPRDMLYYREKFQ